VYRSEKTDCHPFSESASNDLRGGPRRNFQVFDALDFLAELTQHIPDKGEHLVRFYGWYSPRHRGLRAKLSAAGEVTIDRSQAAAARQGSSWAALIQRVYEVDPLTCPRCGGRMRIISFIESRQREVIEKILRHCGLWEGPLRDVAYRPRATRQARRTNGGEGGDARTAADSGSRVPLTRIPSIHELWSQSATL